MELEGVMPDTTAPMLRRLYNDKEWHEETGWLEFKFRHYDPMIGRFTGIDPVSEKFAHVSPFNYAENRVPIGMDLWGLQFTIAVTGDAQIYLNTHFKVLNSSKLLDENLKTLFKENVKNGYLDIMDRDYNGNQYKGWFTYEFVDHVEEGDYFIEIVEPDDPKLKIGSEKAHGMADAIGGKSIVYSTRGIKNADFEDDITRITTLLFSGNEFSNGLLHEMGHLWGLIHPWRLGIKNENGLFKLPVNLFNSFQEAKANPFSISGDLIKSNLMNSGGNPYLMLAPTEQGNSLTDDQFGQIYRNFYNRSEKN